MISVLAPNNVSKILFAVVGAAFFFGDINVQASVIAYPDGASSLDSYKGLWMGYQFGVIQLPTTTSGSAPRPRIPDEWADAVPDGRNPCRSATQETFLDCPCSLIDIGSPVYVECQLQKVGSTIATVIASGSVGPTRYSMTLVSSTSTLLKEYYRVDPFTGFVEIQKQPKGGIFTEVYNVTATNGAGQKCSVLQLKVPG
ncbi:hypothetical protein RvY_05123 [Ramazzottius varieornatus]|uniref:Cadherin domain-containing protein n=1 Tax=Ramazzottius varieornatus TaxID=947166 RepID=A0A1D1V0N2_RAMVA|nr:hypothetical protein RvY_05123 [Ramazzottius varieornatus]